MAYKVGQRVKVREDMSLSKHQEKYRGKFVTIKEVRIDEFGFMNLYKTEESGRLLWWECELEALEPVEEEKTMKFNVGDKVRVRQDIEVNKRYNRVLFASGMEKYKGQIITIEGIICDDDVKVYRYDGWSFVDEMLEPVEEEKKMRNIDVILKDDKLNCNSMCAACYTLKNGNYCSGVSCSTCEFRDSKDCYKFLNAEYKPKIVLNKFEYDLLNSCGKGINYYTFDYFYPLKAMKGKGYFKNVNDTSMKVKDILDNCEIKEE